MTPKAHPLPRFTAALVLLAAATTVLQLEIVVAQDDPCIPLDLECKADEVCRGCKEVVGTNVAMYEECILNYGYTDDECISHKAQPCCQDYTSTDDCLGNAAYVAFYECRLPLDVYGGECTVLSCEAVGAAATDNPASTPVPADITDTTTGTPSPTDPLGPTQAPAAGDDIEAVDDDAENETTTTGNSAGRVAGNAGFLMTTGLLVGMVWAASFV
eukprot:g10634.t1